MCRPRIGSSIAQAFALLSATRVPWLPSRFALAFAFVTCRSQQLPCNLMVIASRQKQLTTPMWGRVFVYVFVVWPFGSWWMCSLATTELYEEQCQLSLQQFHRGFGGDHHRNQLRGNRLQFFWPGGLVARLSAVLLSTSQNPHWMQDKCPPRLNSLPTTTWTKCWRHTSSTSWLYSSRNTSKNRAALDVSCKLQFSISSNQIATLRDFMTSNKANGILSV